MAIIFVFDNFKQDKQDLLVRQSNEDSPPIFTSITYTELVPTSVLPSGKTLLKKAHIAQFTTCKVQFKNPFLYLVLRICVKCQIFLFKLKRLILANISW